MNEIKELEFILNDVKNLCKVKLGEIMLKAFEKFNVTEFSWVQYTPVWCDGEPCYVTSDFYYFTDRYENDVPFGFEAELTKIPNEFLEFAFGTNVSITATIVDNIVQFSTEHFNPEY